MTPGCDTSTPCTVAKLKGFDGDDSVANIILVYNSLSYTPVQHRTLSMVALLHPWRLVKTAVQWRLCSREMYRDD